MRTKIGTASGLYNLFNRRRAILTGLACATIYPEMMLENSLPHHYFAHHHATLTRQKPRLRLSTSRIDVASVAACFAALCAGVFGLKTR